MENEPEEPKSSATPPPDIPPPPPPSAMKKPDIPPPPPPMSPPPPKPAPEEKKEPAKIVTDDEDEKPVAGSEAAFDARVVAAIIDGFVAGGISLVVGMLSTKLGYLVAIGYILTRDGLPFLNGQSIGKRLMKIQAVSMEGKSLSGDWQGTIVRNLSLAIPLFGFVEAYILYSKKDQDVPLRRLGDEWGKTKVVTVAEPSAL